MVNSPEDEIKNHSTSNFWLEEKKSKVKLNLIGDSLMKRLHKTIEDKLK
jgi:hypothetical protein